MDLPSSVIVPIDHWCRHFIPKSLWTVDQLQLANTFSKWLLFLILTPYSHFPEINLQTFREQLVKGDRVLIAELSMVTSSRRACLSCITIILLHVSLQLQVVLTLTKVDYQHKLDARWFLVTHDNTWVISHHPGSGCEFILVSEAVLICITEQTYLHSTMWWWYCCEVEET